MSKSKLTLTLIVLFGAVSRLLATHIVGGSLSYECLSNNPNATSKTYRFTLTIYRDCLTGQAPFDSPAYLGIYRGTYNLNIPVGQMQATPQNERDILIENPECLTDVPSVCIMEATYVFTRTLSKIPDSYFIVYQRCCRNNTITNIQFPGDVGATYFVEITPKAYQLGNDSPVFKAPPPTVLCNNYPIEVDYSATDSDGDKLVYSFCPAYTGGGKFGFDCDSPQPIPGCAPPFSQVNFISPTYSFQKPMAGNPTVSISPQSGIITGKPTKVGQYVVSVCVEEYRNGELLSVVRREYQFNVTACAPQITAKVQSDSLEGKQRYVIKSCDGSKTLTLINESFDSINIKSLKWDIDLKNGKYLNTTDFDATVTFPDYGSYKGVLVLNEKEVCKDTAFFRIDVLPAAKLDLGKDIILCKDSTIVLDAGPDFTAYKWQDGSSSRTFTSTKSGVYSVEATNACGEVLRDSILISISLVGDIKLEDAAICPGQSVIYAVDGFDQYVWSPATGLDCANCAAVKASPASTTTYNVLASNSLGCIKEDQFTVTVKPLNTRSELIKFYKGQSVTIGGKSYNQPGTVILQVPSTQGECDTIITYLLEIIPTKIDINCPANITVAMAANASSAKANYPSPTVSTDCPDPNPTITIVSGLPSGSNFAPGVNTVCYRSANSCGDRDSCCFTVTVSSLKINCPKDAVVAIPSGNNSVAYNYMLSSQGKDCPGAAATLSLTAGLESGAQFPKGSTKVCYSTENNCGNRDSCCFTVTATTLALNCPPDMTVALPANQSTLKVNYASPTSSTNCPDQNVALNLTQGKASGENFGPGTTNQCFSGSNSCGNLGNCCFKITVSTLKAICPPDATVNIPNGSSAVAYTYSTTTQTDHCPTAATMSLATGLASGSLFPKGVNNVCYRAENACGNRDSCCFKVTATTLALTCPPNQTLSLQPGAPSMKVTYADPVSSTNCPDAAVSLKLLEGKASGENFGPGTTKVCYEGSTSCGDKASCCFTVNVQELSNPCDIKVIGCMKFELLDIRFDSINQRRYRIRATNNCATDLNWFAFQLPNGVVAAAPKEASVFTTPAGRAYDVRNPNFSPFYSVRYKQKATGMNNGKSDVFEYRLPQQSEPRYILCAARTVDGTYYEAHLNTFYCPVQPWNGSRPADDDNSDETLFFRLKNDEADVLSVFPNPTDGLLTVQVPQSWLGQNVQLQVQNAQGQLLKTQAAIADSSIVLDLNRLVSNGLYYLTAQNAVGDKMAVRFVLEK